ncbi:mitochondrial ribosomal protein subunit L20-domain-containing protein, partial [Amylostereum chailletii]
MRACLSFKLPSTATATLSCRSYATRLPQKPPMRHPDPLLNNPNATTSSLPGDLTFIHRPPPTSPSPLSLTTDPASPLLKAASTSSQATKLPPPLRAPSNQQPQMSDEDIVEMKRLRASNPTFYTRKRLSEQFNCTPSFVGLMARLSTSDHRAVQQKLEQTHEDVRAQWG